MCFCVTSQPPMWVTQAAPPSRATWEGSTIHVDASVSPSQGEYTNTQTLNKCSVCLWRICWQEIKYISTLASHFLRFLCYTFSCAFLPLHFQGAQQNPGVQFLPDRPGWLPPSLRRRLILPLQHGWILQQLGQGRQIPQGPLTPRVKKSTFRAECWLLRPNFPSI